MTVASPTWEFVFHTIIPHPTEPRLLILEREGVWELPVVRFSVVRPVLPRIDRIAQAIQEMLGVYTTVLRYVYHQANREARCLEAIYVMETHSQNWTPPDNARWVGRDELRQISLASPDTLEPLEEYLAEEESGEIPQGRAPWQRKGWIRSAIDWMQEQLPRSGYTLVAPVEQARNWEISCILRARTNRGDVYFKQAAELPLFSHEPMIMDSLAELYPNTIPKPIAIDAERRWMLMADFGQIMSGASASEHERAMIEFGKVQLDSVGRIEDLLARGCIDRRLNVLESQIDQAVFDEETTYVLEPSEVERLHSLTPRLKEMCRELARYKVPETLVHGDLHPGNIAIAGGNFLFFDWTDSCVSHPFFDVITMLGESIHPTEAWPFESYLSLWQDYEPRERLLEAWNLARTVGILHHAISYQSILSNLDPTSGAELKGASAFWMRKALQSVIG